MNINLTPLEFDDIKTALIAFLRGQTEFTDYNFNDSGWNVVLNIMAYIAHYNAFYANMSVNELLIGSAQLRSNLVQIARHLAFRPYRMHSAALNDVTVEVIDAAWKSSYTAITIPAFTSFASNIGENFVNTKPINLTGINNWLTTINLVQGTVTRVEKTATLKELPFQQFTIPYTDIAESHLHVYVEDTTGDKEYNGTTYKEWTRFSSITQLNSTAEIYFVYEDMDMQPIVQFGNDALAKIPTGGNKILFEFLRTEGTSGNGATIADIGPFQAETNIGSVSGGASNISIVLDTDSDGAVIPSSGGSDRETAEEIRLRAPLFNAAQGRAVSSGDYYALIPEWEYAGTIDAFSVWGGEENTPIKYGTVFVAIKPTAGTELSDFYLASLIHHLKSYNVLTISPEIVTPTYVYVDVTSIVRYDSNYSVGNISSSVAAAIDNYFDTNVAGFNTRLKHSRFVRAIDDVTGVINNITALALFTNFQYSVDGIYSFELYNQLMPESLLITLQPGQTSPPHTNVVYIRDDGEGRIIFDDGTTTSLIGTVDYDTGSIVFTTDMLKSGITYSMYFDTLYEDIDVSQRLILELNSKDITTEAVSNNA